MAETKRRLAMFSFYDQTAIEKELEKMAEEGWMIEKPGNMTWKYRKTEPKKLKFTVTYFPNASEFDAGPTDKQLLKEDFCAMDGWTLAVRWGTMQIFYNEDPDAVPIETDPVTKVENIRKSMKKNLFIPHMLEAFLMIYQIYYQIWRFLRNPVDWLSDPASVFLFPMWVFFLIVCIIEIVSGYMWCRKAVKAAKEDGIFLALESRKSFSYIYITVGILIVLLAFGSFEWKIYYLIYGFTGTFAAFFLTKLLMSFIKKCKFSRIVNQMIVVGGVVLMTIVVMGSLVVVIIRGDVTFPGKSEPVETYEFNGHSYEIYDDELPLEAENLMEVDGKWSKRIFTAQKTFLAAKREYAQWALYTEPKGLPELDYTIIDAKFPVIYELCKKELLEVDDEDIELFGISYEALNAADYGVREIYQKCYDGEPTLQYIICYGERIVELWLDGDYKEEHLEKAIEILRP